MCGNAIVLHFHWHLAASEADVISPVLITVCQHKLFTGSLIWINKIKMKNHGFFFIEYFLFYCISFFQLWICMNFNGFRFRPKNRFALCMGVWSTVQLFKICSMFFVFNLLLSFVYHINVYVFLRNYICNNNSNFNNNTLVIED